MELIGKIKTRKGDYYKVFWDLLSKRVSISQNAEGPFFSAESANDKEQALKNARLLIDSIDR